MFNLNHPEGYKDRSLSVSDVVEVMEDPMHPHCFYFCDSIGFKPIDFEPVVRCKDCKYFTNNIADENLRKNFCDRIQINCFHPVKENDYCSYGVKMDEEEKYERDIIQREKNN